MSLSDRLTLRFSLLRERYFEHGSQGSQGPADEGGVLEVRVEAVNVPLGPPVSAFVLPPRINKHQPLVLVAEVLQSDECSAEGQTGWAWLSQDGHPIDVVRPPLVSQTTHRPYAYPPLTNLGYWLGYDGTTGRINNLRVPGETPNLPPMETVIEDDADGHMELVDMLHRDLESRGMETALEKELEDDLMKAVSRNLFLLRQLAVRYPAAAGENVRTFEGLAVNATSTVPSLAHNSTAEVTSSTTTTPPTAASVVFRPLAAFVVDTVPAHTVSVPTSSLDLGVRLILGIIPPSLLEEASYRFQLSITVPGAELEGSAVVREVGVELNRPPTERMGDMEGGTATVVPTEGRSFETIFQISVAECFDKDLPVTYNIWTTSLFPYSPSPPFTNITDGLYWTSHVNQSRAIVDGLVPVANRSLLHE
ncbi:unnamed protein product [Vitrella brassicaformis CCMP3155]|uniref:Uncharacterized protein n=1 Tax=Vitrella brassicaformis (strain CCMP3155) TaxID=1169540 RepID=A0A0G4F6D6_VITBC|nr:unnamed protein product [Vitrella brassicaformis CCMP3155]|eukprot:CEM07681.1 unnamed protein product [Vitrella brassicaformis CCMP3155]